VSGSVLSQFRRAIFHSAATETQQKRLSMTQVAKSSVHELVVRPTKGFSVIQSEESFVSLANSARRCKGPPMRPKNTNQPIWSSKWKNETSKLSHSSLQSKADEKQHGNFAHISETHWDVDHLAHAIWVFGSFRRRKSLNCPHLNNQGSDNQNTTIHVDLNLSS